LSPFGPLDFLLAASTGTAYRRLGTFPDLIALRWNFSPATLIAQIGFNRPFVAWAWLEREFLPKAGALFGRRLC
jgi:hypothetical protein